MLDTTILRRDADFSNPNSPRSLTSKTKNFELAFANNQRIRGIAPVKTLKVPVSIKIASTLTYQGITLKLHPHTQKEAITHEQVHLKAYQSIIDNLAAFLNEAGKSAMIPEEKVEEVLQPMALAFLIDIYEFELRRQGALHLDHWKDKVLGEPRRVQGHWKPKHLEDTYKDRATLELIAASFPDLFPNGISSTPTAKNRAKETIDGRRDQLWSEFKTRFKSELR